ncbi:hypothetical protein BD310DRAFT_953241 [Dichomitus squalens]|uniref:Uncharacterized protein n=1 Tax=Dichomitus squalens TaxID=114155 RepID=A0A4Q9PAL5_9APHY|nr:hypothetical protein BD310DRAFT_953241 [Dichomitus squalens]
MSIAAIYFMLSHIAQDDGCCKADLALSDALWQAYISALTLDVVRLSSHHKHPLPAASSFTCYGDNSAGSDAGVQPPPNRGKPEKNPWKKWTMEETHMLVAGVLRSRVIQCTNLRDRLRNASPDCYQAVGYKRSNTTKKTYEGSEGKDHRPAQPLRTATDDTLTSSSSTGPVRRKRRGSTKSVPESDSPGGTPHMTGDELVTSPDGETKELEMHSPLSELTDSSHLRVVYGHEHCLAYSSHFSAS